MFTKSPQERMLALEDSKFKKLHDDVGAYIFSFLTHSERAKAAQTCQHFRFLSSAPSVWQDLLQRDFYCRASKDQNPEDYYRVLYVERRLLMNLVLTRHYILSTVDNLNEPQDFFSRFYQLPTAPSLARLSAVKKLCGISEEQHSEMIKNFNHVLSVALSNENYSGSEWYKYLHDMTPNCIIGKIQEKPDVCPVYFIKAQINKGNIKEAIQLIEKEQHLIKIYIAMLNALFKVSFISLTGLILDKQPGLVNSHIGLEMPLYVAIREENRRLMQQLIAKHADVNAIQEVCITVCDDKNDNIYENKGYLSPLLFLLITAPHRTDMVELLLQGGANLDDADKQGHYNGRQLDTLSYIEELKTKTDNSERVKKTLALLAKWKEVKNSSADEEQFFATRCTAHFL